MRVPGIPVFFTDAGPPPSLVFLTTWTLVLGFSYIIFGLKRSAACVTSLPHSVEKKEAVRHSPHWWGHQLHLCVASWLLFDVVHRVLSYVLLPSRILWRRQMLPLHHGRCEWLVNQLRFAVLCRTPSGYSDDICADWKLPVAASPFSKLATPEGRHHMNDGEWARCQWVAFSSLVTVVGVLLLGVSLVSRFLHMGGTTRMMSAGDTSTPLKEMDGGMSEGGSDLDSGCDEVQWWGLGEPDDACLSSPEALAEEMHWKALAAGERDAQSCCGHRGYTGILFLCEHWPILVAVCYAGLYAFSGSMPLLMRWVYPVCVVLVACPAIFL